MNKYDYFLQECPRPFVEVASFAVLFVLALPTSAMAQDQVPSGSVLNILLLGLIAYFLVRMFRRRMGGGTKRDDNHFDNRTSNSSDEAEKKGRVIRPMDRHEAARQMWGHLSSDKQEASANWQGQKAQTSDFDEKEFLEGAKLFFTRFQQASDTKDFEELKVFLSDEVYADAVFKAERNAAGSRTEIMLLNATLVEMRNENERTMVTVSYDGQLRRGEHGERTERIRTLWEFSRNDTVDNDLWTLNKINKVDQ